jgi:hypothetical protein
MMGAMGSLMEPLKGLLRIGGSQRGLETGIVLGGMARVRCSV